MFSQYRKTKAVINLGNLYDNYKNISDIVPNKTIIPVVKANAYGHGSIQVVSYLRSKGVKYFAVSLLEEALELRECFDDIGILVMGIVEPKDYKIASDENITITIGTKEQLVEMEYEKPLKVHINFDTGMNRLGFKSDGCILSALNFLSESKMFFIEGIYTHFSTADDSYEYYQKQLYRFKVVLTLLDHPFDMIHISNSSSTIKYEKDIDFTTHARVGISLYGLTLDKETSFLKNTFSLQTKIHSIKKLQAFDKVGYGAAYQATENEIIGVLPIGYADGFIRKNGSGDVEINGKRYPIVGRICMDQMFIKIDEDVSTDDDVILFGGLITIDEVASRLETINYEVICIITSRVPRIYIK
jgi:alanine racemase